MLSAHAECPDTAHEYIRYTLFRNLARATFETIAISRCIEGAPLRCGALFPSLVSGSEN